MKLVDSILVALVLLASLCCLVAADMDRESCKNLAEDPDANWETSSQIIECYRKDYSDKFTGLLGLMRNSTDKSNCVDKPRWIRNMVEYRKSNSLRRALIAYGLRLSASCRKDMVNVVSSQLDGILKEEDFAAVARWTNDSSPVAKLFALDKENRGLALPSPMVKLLKGQDINSFVSVEVPQNSAIAKAYAVCKRRFKPIYEKLINPLIELAMMGFNYEPETSATDAETVRKVQQMYRLVFGCKFLVQVKLFENSRMEAGQMKIIKDSFTDGDKLLGAHKYPEIEELKFDHELIDERQATGDDQLVDVNNSELMKAIQGYHVPSSHLGHKTSLKMAASSLAQKMSNTFGGNKVDKDDERMANFVADYSNKLSSLKRKKSGIAVGKGVLNTISLVAKWVLWPLT